MPVKVQVKIPAETDGLEKDFTITTQNSKFKCPKKWWSLPVSKILGVNESQEFIGRNVQQKLQRVEKARGGRGADERQLLPRS